MVLNEYLPKDCLDYLINEFFVPAKKHVSIVKFLQFCVDTCCDTVMSLRVLPYRGEYMLQ